MVNSTGVTNGELTIRWAMLPFTTGERPTRSRRRWSRSTAREPSPTSASTRLLDGDVQRERDGSDGLPTLQSNGGTGATCDECHGQRDDLDGQRQSRDDDRLADASRWSNATGTADPNGAPVLNVPFTTGQAYAIAPKVVSITRAGPESDRRADGQLHGDVQ
jgi:hypothetical protein